VAGLDGLPQAAPEAQAPTAETPGTTPSRPSRWATLLARIYEVFPLVCPTCQSPLSFIAVLTDPDPITQILAHIGEPTSPTLHLPATVHRAEHTVGRFRDHRSPCSSCPHRMR
jgi:hypothetical protein